MQDVSWLAGYEELLGVCARTCMEMQCQPPTFPSGRGVPMTGSLRGSDPIA